MRANLIVLACLCTFFSSPPIVEVFLDFLCIKIKFLFS
jgi:hypothetical protein